MTPAALWTAAVATAAAILSFDLLLPLGVAGGVPYVLLVLLALKSPSRNAALGLAAAGSVLTVFGFFLSEPGSTLWIVLTNRALALFVIWISVLPVVRYQRIRFGGVMTRIDVEDIMNSMMEAIFISDERTIILAVNESAEAMFGYSAKELIGKSAAVLRPEPERSRHQAANEEFQRTGRTTFAGRGLIEERGLRKDGSIFPMEMQVGKLWRNGQLYFVSTTRDVSARIEAENSQRQTQELFEKAFHLSPHPASLTRTSDRRFIDVNEAWLQAMGRTREEAIGATADELGIWADTARRDELYGIIDTAQSVHDFDAVWQAKDGRCVDVVVSVERLALDDGSANLLIAYDQTESKKVEKALRESEERFSKAFQVSPLMTTLLWLEHGRCIDVNDAWLEGTGYPREAVVGQTSDEVPIWVDPDRRLMAHELLRETGSLRQFEAQWRKRDGSVIDVLLHAERLDLDGKQAVLSIARDVTEERRTEAALRESGNALPRPSRSPLL
jgi:PAS domain S-box-containing protein